MPLSPAPLLPGTSPLTPPGHRPPNRRALGLGALISLLTLVAVLVVGQVFLSRLLFLAPSLQTSTGEGNQSGAVGITFQGFQYPWTRSDGSTGGYNSPMSLQNMQSQEQLFHMNAVIIPVVADMPYRYDSYIAWRTSDLDDVHTLPEPDYAKAITDARKAGLLPILELQIRQQDPSSGPDDSAELVGVDWAVSYSSQSLGTNGPSK